MATQLDPYVTSTVLTNAPTGIAWSSIPSVKATEAAKAAAVADIALRATSTVNGYCNQTLRATINTEELSGPDYRMVMLPTAVTLFRVSRWPILAVLGGQVSSAAVFPPDWTSIPANKFRPREPALGSYGTDVAVAGQGASSIELAPGYVNWNQGRNGYRLQIIYTNGWPHCTLTASATAGSASVTVSNVTGWVGATGEIQDSAETETFFVTNATGVSVTLPDGTTALTGPGVLQLQSPTLYNHDIGTMATTLPRSVQWATVLYCVAEALTRGATATTVPSMPGGETSTGKSTEELITEAEMILNPYRRVI